VRSEDEDAVIGIKYFSCASVYASTLGNNYVFPTMGTPYQTRKTITDYCARLSHRFKLTGPKFLKEYEDIFSCEKALNDDNQLDYIEDFDAGEEEEIAEEYTIPEGVSAIGAFAFSGCSSLKSINIPDSVTSICNGAFSDCSSLTEINIPDSVTTIGDSAFSDCKSLKSINIPDSVTTIGQSAFFACSSLTKINIPDNVMRIGDRAFLGCSSLTTIIVNYSNEDYTSVDGILYNKNKTRLVCYPAGKNQTSFAIPSDVTSIGDNAFSGCDSLKWITIPESVTSIGNDAFSFCSSLTKITIPNSVISIGDDAFSYCSSLTKITIPNSVISIGELTFFACRKLTRINIPDSVMSIGDFAFSECSSLANITVSFSNESYTSVDGILYNKNKTWLVYYPAGKIQTSFAIPSEVTSIGNGSFSYCHALTRITIPESMTSIGEYAFYCCSELTSINIPDSVTSIGDDAFCGCFLLKTVYYPGTQEQAESIIIGKHNECLQNAKWVYGSSGSES
jgi:hypothetical protein